MLLKPIFLTFALAVSAFANPIPEADAPDLEAKEIHSLDTFPPRPPNYPYIKFHAIGMEGKKKRTLSLDELIYMGKWLETPPNPQSGCKGSGRQSSGEILPEAFGALFEDDVQGVAISRSTSGAEIIRAGTGLIWNLTPKDGNYSRPCGPTQAIAFTGLRMGSPPKTLFSKRNPFRGRNAFAYVRVPQDVVNIQRQYLHLHRVTIYASFFDLNRDTAAYEKELYFGDVQ